MDIFPRARRVLLTAYADTDAAISAINTVDLDHYLLKPWNPPEEQLYPVVDGLLAAWKASTDPATDAVRVVGHRWSAPSHEVRDFLASNGVPYRWLAADEPEGERLLDAAGLGAEQLPVVLTEAGDPLVQPSTAELAAAVGLVTSAASDFYDVVIVGGGPAGLGAAVYAASEGLRTVLIERHATGGQAGQSSRIENYLGFPDGVSGGQLTQRARQQAVKFGAELVTACEAVSLEVAGSARVVHCADGSRSPRHTVVLAPGVSYRSLDCPELDTFAGNGVFYGAATTEAPNCAGTDVYVVGGANSAGQAAMFFSRRGEVGDAAGPRRRRCSGRCRATWSSSSSRSTPSRCGPGRWWPAVTATAGWSGCASATSTPGSRRPCPPSTCSCSSARSRSPTGSATPWSATSAGSCWPVPTCWSTASDRPAGTPSATRGTWRHRFLGCSSPATYARIR